MAIPYPYVFANENGNVPASQLDANFTAASDALDATNADVANLDNQVATLSAGSAYANWSLTASVAASALTITLKDGTGATPSSGSPVSFLFRSSTPTSGLPAPLSVTSTLAITVPSGASLGMANNVAARIWVVIFNDSGTPRLGVIRCKLTDGVFPLSEDILESSTTISSGATSAGIFYTDTGVTTKAFRVLGYLEATEATAGTWASSPSVIYTRASATPLPGAVVQVRRNQTGTVATGTTLVPFDNTIPQNTEGDQYMTQAITPTSAINNLAIQSVWCGTNNAANTVAVCLFQDTTANSLAVAYGVQAVSAAASCVTIVVAHLMSAGTTSATTFKIRTGAIGAGTTVFNGVNAGTQVFGGVAASSLSVTEIMV